jgi:transposase
MSLQPHPRPPVPEETARVAHAAFPKGNTYLRLRDELGPLYEDRDFATLFPKRGQPGLSPGLLALVTVMQFLENLSDRQAADAVRARIDWKYALGLELTDPGFDFSVLCEFRARLVAGAAEQLLLDRMLERLRARGLVKARGQQRTDSTHVLAAIRVLNRLELVGETLRATLNQLATVAPEWTRGVARPEWFERYSHRVEDSRLPKERAEREAYALMVGEDGFALLDALDADEAAAKLRSLPAVQVLRTAWTRHYDRTAGSVRWRTDAELPQADERIESPYDPEARYRTKRALHWTGYMVHVTETCDKDDVHIITHVMTTTADVHEACCTAPIHQALVDQGLPPDDHLVDAAYVDAELLVRSRQEHGIDLVGPPRPDASWQSKVEGAYDASRFAVDWEAQRVTCPEGKVSSSWSPQVEPTGAASIAVKFRPTDCGPCVARALCTRSKQTARALKLHPREEHEALQAARARLETEEGKQLYRRRAGVEGTLSQGVRAFGLRRSRYRGLAKTQLQHVITAGAMNLARLAAWFAGEPPEETRTSRFARLRMAG